VETEPCEQFANRRALVGNPLEDMFDAEICGTRSHHSRAATGNDGQFDAATLQEFQAETVLDVEGLEFKAVVGEQRPPSVITPSMSKAISLTRLARDPASIRSPWP